MTEGAAELVAQVIVGLMIALTIELRSVVSDYIQVFTQHVEKLDSKLSAMWRLIVALPPLLGFLVISLLSISSLAICLNAVIENESVGHTATRFVRFSVSAMCCAVVILPGIVFAMKSWRLVFPKRQAPPAWFFLLIQGFCGVGIGAVLVLLN